MHDACNCAISISKWLRDWLENVLDLIRGGFLNSIDEAFDLRKADDSLGIL
jgi:hypothetical protein